MRYYSILITNPKTGALIIPQPFVKLNPAASYTSFINGQTIPAALNVEFDAPISTYASPWQGSWLRISGVSLQEISQSNDLAGCNIIVFAGMKKGLPLANSEQSKNPLIVGKIFQCFGNWDGRNQALQMVLQPSTGLIEVPANISMNWEANTPLAGAIFTALKTAFPSYKIVVAISPNLVMSSTQPGYYPTLATFAKAVKTMSLDQQFRGIKPLGGGEYGGVEIKITGSSIIVYDGTIDTESKSSFGAPTEIAFQDLIGQPTWIGPITINFKTVMRSDIGIGDVVVMPKTLASNPLFAQQSTASAGTAFVNVPARSRTIFQGKFRIVSIHHFANFRQSDAGSWATVFNANALPLAPTPEGI